MGEFSHHGYPIIARVAISTETIHITTSRPF